MIAPGLIVATCAHLPELSILTGIVVAVISIFSFFWMCKPHEQLTFKGAVKSGDQYCLRLVECDCKTLSAKDLCSRFVEHITSLFFKN